MNIYQVATAITLHTGILGLTPAQAASRRAALTDLGEGLYQIQQPVQFKAGEVIAYDGPMTKAMASQIKPKKGKK